MVRKAIVFMADGMEMCECLLTVDILRRAGVEVTTASVMGQKQVMASHQVLICADTVAEDADFSSADIVILPGGRVGTENIRKSDIACAQARAFAADPEKYVAAICAAPSVLAGLGILDGKKATCHPGFVERVMLGSSFYDKDTAEYTAESTAVPDSSPLVDMVHESVVVDGNVITGQALGATMEFALCIAEILAGKQKADEVAAAICFRK